MPKFTFKFNSIFQIIASIIQVGNQYSDVIPVKYKGLAAGIMGILQGAMAIRAHFLNPDGSPATEAFIPKN